MKSLLTKMELPIKLNELVVGDRFTATNWRSTRPYLIIAITDKRLWLMRNDGSIGHATQSNETITYLDSMEVPEKALHDLTKNSYYIQYMNR